MESILKINRQRHVIGLFVCVLFFAGCQAVPARAQAPQTLLPPGLNPKVVRPYVGTQLEKARLSRQQILTVIKRPDFLPSDPVALQKKLDQQPDVEPPLVAMFAYIKARLAWEDQRLFEARQYLQRALALAPNSKHLLHMLAQLWGAAGNRDRSSAYLKKVVELDPLNVKLVLQLGGFALDQDRFEEAIALFEYVQKQVGDEPESDSALMPLVNYYLGAALDRAGYALASVEAYRAFLTADIQSVPRDPREARRLELLIAQRGLLWRQVGDTYCKLQEYEQALVAYRTAMTVGVSSPIDIIRRLVYVCLKMDRPDLASPIVIELLQKGQLDQPVADLIRFVAQQVPDRQQWTQQIQTHLKNQATDSQAMLLLDLFKPAVAMTMVRDHLKTQADDPKAIRWLLDHLKINVSDTDLAEAMKVTLAAMTRNPQQADLDSVLLVSRVTDQSRLQKSIRQLPQNEYPEALRLFLLAQTYARASDLPQAQKLLEEAIGVDDQLTVARLRLAVLHMSLKQFDQAEKILERVKDLSSARVVNIRVKLLIQAKRLDDALSVLDRAIELRPTDVNLILQKAQLQIQNRKIMEAQKTLLDALDTNPLAESIYEVLFELYDQGAVPDSTRKYQQLMRRILKTIPRSPVARMRVAQTLAAGGQTDRARKIFLELLEENPQNYRVLSELLGIYRQTQRLEKAEKLLNQKIEKTPEDRLLWRIAKSHYQQAGQRDKWFKFTQQMIRKFEKEPMQTLQLAGLYLENDRVGQGISMLQACWQKKDLKEDAAMVLVSLLSGGYVKLKKNQPLEILFEQALKRYPDRDADLLYTWALVQDQLAKPKRSEELMLKLLAKYPDHGPANNGLGYTWANQGKHLERAHEMLQKAVALDSDNSAYLDSLGWVLYKLGRFEAAIEYLKRSQASRGGDNPVILNHLGDALYRHGKVAEALKYWQRAQKQLGKPQVELSPDPELSGLDGRLESKISAVAEKKDVPVAAVGEAKTP